MSQSKKNSSLVFGTFNSERFWRDINLTRLPALNDAGADNIVAAMDELLFITCQTSDVLITKFKLNSAFKDYLSEVGFSFIHNEKDLVNNSSINEQDSHKSVCQLLLETNDKDYYQNLLTNKIKVSPYSVISCTEDMCKKYGIIDSLPEINTVKKVNSKIYSKNIVYSIGARAIGKVAYSHKQLKEIGEEYLKSSPIVIKDEYGVSGKGNVLVSSVRMLQRIATYIAAQEQQSGYTRLIVEPLLDKELDFSCQLYIDRQGNSKILSVQQMFNNGFAYQGSCKAEDILIDVIANSGYLLQIEKVASQLYKDGYFGYVCVDSMLLKDGELIPVLEINARKSMGLINHYVDEFLSNFSLQGNLVYLSLGYSNNIEFQDIITIIRSQGILFDLHCMQGILPLSANTLFINREINKSRDIFPVHKGRFYVSVIGKSSAEREFMLTRLKNILVSLGFRIYN